MSVGHQGPVTAGLRRYPFGDVLPLNGERFLIPGPVGDIEAELSGITDNAPAAIAVVCHPHPLREGTMTNKVVHMVAKAFNELGAVALRFNFRGVGQTQGVHDHGVGEAEDLQAVVQWLRTHYPAASLWLAGFSFGASVVYRAQAELKPERLLLVAPPVTQDYFPAAGAFPAAVSIDRPWTVIQGSADEVIEAGAVTHWVQAQQPAPDYQLLEGAGHFFHGRLIELRERIKATWG